MGPFPTQAGLQSIFPFKPQLAGFTQPSVSIPARMQILHAHALAPVLSLPL